MSLIVNLLSGRRSKILQFEQNVTRQYQKKIDDSILITAQISLEECIIIFAEDYASKILNELFDPSLGYCNKFAFRLNESSFCLLHQFFVLTYYKLTTCELEELSFYVDDINLNLLLLNIFDIPSELFCSYFSSLGGVNNQSAVINTVSLTIVVDIFGVKEGSESRAYALLGHTLKTIFMATRVENLKALSSFFKGRKLKWYFDILGLRIGSTREEIRLSYRRLAHKYHPDKGGDERKFREINDAYNKLNGLINE